MTRWAAVLATVVLLGACVGCSPQRTYTDKYSTAGIAAVRLDGPGIRVIQGTMGRLVRETTLVGDRPPPSHRIEGDVLVLGGCPVDGCGVSYTLVVAAGGTGVVTGVGHSIDVEGRIGIEIDATVRELRVHEVTGPVSIVAKAETVTLEAVTGAVMVRLDGVLLASRQRGSVDIEATHVALQVAEPADVRVRVESGEVTVPPADYELVVSGQVETSLSSHPGAPHRLDLAATSRLSLAMG